MSRCRPQRWHQESPTMALNLKEDPAVMAPGNAISFWNILFFSDCSFPAYWKPGTMSLVGRQSSPLVPGNPAQPELSRQSVKPRFVQGCLIVRAFRSQIFFFYCQHREDRVRKSLDLLFPVWPHWKSIFLFLLSLISLIRTSGFWVIDLSLLGPPGVRFLS